VSNYARWIDMVGDETLIPSC